MSQDTRPALIVSLTENQGAKTTTKDAVTSGQRLTLAGVSEKAAALGAKVTDRRVIRTAALVLAMFCMGLYFRIVDPTLIDLKDRLGVGYEEISRVLAGHTVGYFLSAVAGGLFMDLLPQYACLVLGSSFFLAGVGTVGTPYATSLWGLVVMQHIAGWGHGFTDTAVTVLCTQLWGDQASVPLHATQAGYPLGSFAIQLIVIPFVSPDRTPSNVSTPLPFPLERSVSPPLTVDQARPTSHIQWPYAGVAAAQFAMFVLFFYFQYSDMAHPARRKVKVKKTPQSISAFFSPGRFLKGSSGKASLLLFLLLLFYILVQAQMSAFTQYTVSYLVETGMYGKADANVVYSSFWVCIAVMRWLSTAVAAWVPVYVMLSVELTSLCAAAVAMAFWGATNKTVFWVLTCVCGLAVAPIVPGGNAWANQNLEASPVVFALCLIGAAIGGTASSSATGYLFEHVGPRSILYLFMGCCCALLLVFIVMQVSVSSIWDRMSSREDRNEDVIEVDAGVTEKLYPQPSDV
ncbi:sodium-dependent glucose transporter 1-like [Branchiostoma floridae x Branchiostoma japonicum]